MIIRYEENSQIKKIKIIRLKNKYENFNGETIENMDNRLIHVQNEFSELEKNII
jgi:hypothetical protein